MPDLRRPNFHRHRTRGIEKIFFASLNAETNGYQIIFDSDNFYIKEIRDEEHGYMEHRISLYDLANQTQADREAADILIYQNERLEVKSMELKYYPSAFWEVTAVRVGAIA